MQYYCGIFSILGYPCVGFQIVGTCGIWGSEYGLILRSAYQGWASVYGVKEETLCKTQTACLGQGSTLMNCV